MKYILYLSVLLNACSSNPSFPTKPDQDIATYIVWEHEYHMEGVPSPLVDWWSEKIPCPPPAGTMCDGAYYNNQNIAEVVWFGSFHQTAMAHEFLHAKLLFETGDPDSNHKNPGFRPGGLVDITNIELAERGL